MPTLPLGQAWRRALAAFPPTAQLSGAAIAAVAGATALILAGTWSGAADGLKLQLERQLSRDLNVVEAWHAARVEEVQLTAVGLVRHRELAAALHEAPASPALGLVRAEQSRLRLGYAALLNPQLAAVGPLKAQVVGGGVPAAALKRREPVVASVPFKTDDWPAWQGVMPIGGLVRVVATPLGPPGGPEGVLVLAEALAPGSGFPERLVGLMGGAVAVLTQSQVAGSAGFPPEQGEQLGLGPEVWAGVREGRYFFTEAGPGPYLMAFRPIFDHEGRTVGAFARGFPEAVIAESLWRSAGTVAAASGAALAMALVGVGLALRLARLEARGVARERWLGRVITAQEEERSRVARELHDQTGQALTGLMVALKALEAGPEAQAVAPRLAMMRGMVGQALEEVRGLSMALRPPILDELGLPAALASLARQQAEAMGWRLHLDLPEAMPSLPAPLALTAYRVAQEAITNVARHAEAQNLRLSLRLVGDRLNLQVQDDGQGFDPIQAEASKRLGLVGMRERAALVGGQLSLEAASGQGCRVRFDAPLKPPSSLEAPDA